MVPQIPRTFFLAILITAAFSFHQAHAGNNLLIDNFEETAMRNRLGGFIGSDTEDPGTCQFSFTQDPADTFGHATHSLQVDYDVSKRGSYTYMWLHLGPEEAPGIVLTRDLGGFSYLSFWVRSPNKGENFKVELHSDTNKNGRYDPGEDQSSHVYVNHYVGKGGMKDQWRKVVIPLSHFSGVTDLSRAIEIVFVFENSRGNRKGTIVLDEVLLGVNRVPKTAEPVALPVPVVSLPPTVPVDPHPIFMGGQTHPLGAQYIPSMALEGIGFEVSWDGGTRWCLVGIDYEPTGGMISVPWVVPPIPPSDRALLRVFSQGIGEYREHASRPLDVRIQGYTDARLIEEMTRRSFQYFQENQDPDTGLFLDSAGSDASTAVTGFGLAALAIGADEGWMDLEEARARVLKTLQTFALLQRGESVAENLRSERENAKQATRPAKGVLEDMFDFETTKGILSTLAKTPQALGHLLGLDIPPSRDGFFYHFMQAGSAERAGDSEVSVVDTALFHVGALVAAEYFGGEVRTLAQQIYDGAQWDKYYDAQKGSIRMAWSPEQGYFSTYWDYFTDETVLLHILAAGSTTHPVPGDAFYNFQRNKGVVGDGEEFVYSWSGALFTHQYAAAWIDLRDTRDKQGWDWWENSRRAVIANRDHCWYNQEHPRSYGPHRWGVSSFHRPEGYVMHYGILPNGSDEAREDGTLSPIAVASAITFIPFEAISDVKDQVTAHPYLLGPNGLRNGYNLERNWFSNVDFGLDTGLLLLSLKNFRDGFIWKMLNKNAVVQKGLIACGISKVKDGGAPSVRFGLPPVPKNAPQEILMAQTLVAKMEALHEQGDLSAYSLFIQQNDMAYGKALNLLDRATGLEPQVSTHREWLRALIALRQSSRLRMRRHFWKMMQSIQDSSSDINQNMNLLEEYLGYIARADLRDFQEGAYKSFYEMAGKAENGSLSLENFARYCLSWKRFSLASRAWTDAMALQRADPAQIVQYARQVAQTFLQAGRVDFAMAFDRTFLDQIPSLWSESKIAGVQIYGLLELGRRYQDIGQWQFAKEWYDAALALPTTNGKNAVLYQLATLEEETKFHDKAIKHFKTILKSDPEQRLKEHAEFGVAMNTFLLENNAQSLEALRDFVQKNPQGELRDKAALRVGLAYLDRRNFKMAGQYLRNVSAKSRDLYQLAQNSIRQIP